MALSLCTGKMSKQECKLMFIQAYRALFTSNGTIAYLYI